MYFRDLNNELYNQGSLINNQASIIEEKASLIEEKAVKEKKAFENNGKNLSDVSITDTTGLTCNLSSIIEQKLVIFNFSTTNCSHCYEFIIELLKSYQDNNLIIIYNGNNIRDLKLLLKKHVFKVKVYYSPVIQKSFPSIIENLPCFFTINRNLEINSVYFPLKNEVDFIKEYLRINNIQFSSDA
jgi:thiol-disulfide isomerase/thioredoxin